MSMKMTMAEFVGLEPCPFCGGEASKRLFYKGKYRVHCNVCDAHSGDVCDTEAEAIAAWNTRSVGTCENVDTDDDCYFECSKCGSATLVEYKSGGYGVPNYCPNCGCKVVS